jgi:hypothetical protein
MIQLSARAIRIARRTGTLLTIKLLTRMPPRPICEPTDRSSPPDIITNVVEQAMIAT